MVGPPSAGKLAYVQDHRNLEDLVVDYNSIVAALGGDHTAAMAARNAVLRSLRRGEVDVHRAWIISANPTAESMFPYHDRVVVDPGRDAVLSSVAGTGGGSERAALVHDWYAKRDGKSASTEVVGSRVW